MEREQVMDGFLQGDVVFDGQLMNYPTYEGRGQCLIKDSTWAREVLPVYARNLIEATTGAEGRDTVLRHVPRGGSQGVPAGLRTGKFTGEHDCGWLRGFRRKPELRRKRERDFPPDGEHPLLGAMSDLVSLLGRSIVSYRLRGTVHEPDPQGGANDQPAPGVNVGAVPRIAPAAGKPVTAIPVAGRFAVRQTEAPGCVVRVSHPPPGGHWEGG
jgi:hypothetical protein